MAESCNQDGQAGVEVVLADPIPAEECHQALSAGFRLCAKMWGLGRRSQRRGPQVSPVCRTEPQTPLVVASWLESRFDARQAAVLIFRRRSPRATPGIRSPLQRVPSFRIRGPDLWLPGGFSAGSGRRLPAPAITPANPPASRHAPRSQRLRVPPRLAQRARLRPTRLRRTLGQGTTRKTPILERISSVGAGLFRSCSRYAPS